VTVRTRTRKGRRPGRPRHGSRRSFLQFVPGPQHTERDPLFAVLLTAMRCARIRVGEIHHPSRFVFGRHDPDGTIWINEASYRAYIGLHEMVHFVFPAWSEEQATARWLEMLGTLSHDDLAEANRQLCQRIQAGTRREPSRTRRLHGADIPAPVICPTGRTGGPRD
jgi:hypothetical protein